MKQSRFAGLLFCAMLVIYLSSCGGNGSEKATTADSTAQTDTAAKTVAVEPKRNTIVTTPENLLVVTHKVANFEKWKIGYEAHDSARLASGIHNYVLGRGLQDSNVVMIAMKVDDVAKAKAFGNSADLKNAMKKAGVIGAPTVFIVTETWQDTATIDTRLRSRTMFSVKDWDAWKTAFEEGRQERIDNGILDRVIGHDVDYNKKVALVTAVTDTAKAFAYYKSDALKKRREASGVVGEPVRFLFRIVKRY
ncbi:MAG: hypothetical protein JSS70_08910 [Bacteroidetes bacterium]|nr:hypothetical protein [Bacteroidota bacterium]